MGMSLAQPPPYEPSGTSGCKRQAVVQMRCCTEDVPCRCAGTRDSLPAHDRLLDHTVHAMDQFTKGAGKTRGLSYVLMWGQSSREKYMNNFNLMGHLPS